MKLCKLKDCANESRALNYCSKHYQQIKILGYIKKPFDRRCEVTGCDNKHNSHGFCNRHYLQFRKYGKITPLRKAIIEGDIAKIPLGSNNMESFAIVDVKNAWLDKYSWSLHHGYVEGRVNGKVRSMHRYIMGDPSDFEIDHINRNPSDNRLANLRLCNKAENSRNKKRRKSNRTYQGVTLTKSGKFTAAICFNYKVFHLGTFKLEEDAARAYDAKARELHSDFAFLNFPD